MSFWENIIKPNKIIIFIALIFFHFCILFAAPYDMILVGDPILDDLLFLSVDSGISILSFTPPFPPHEIEMFLSMIDVSELSPSAQDAFYRVNDRLYPSAPLNITSDFFTLFVNINAELEMRARTNYDIPWHPFYSKPPAIISIPTRAFFSDSVCLYIEPMFAVDPQDYSNFYYFGTNLPINTERIADLNLPLRAFFTMGGPWWNFQLGRDRLFYGTGHTGNLAISDIPDFYEFMRLSFFSKILKYSLLVSQMPLELSDEFYPKLDTDAGYLTRTTQRYLYLHRLDFTLFKKLSIGLMEGIMVGNSSPEIRYLNPLMVYHSFFAWYNYDSWQEGYSDMVGSLLGIEVNWNITKSLAFYGQFNMNEFATQHELRIDPEQPPNCLGYMAGLRFSRSYNTWASLFFIEFVKTDPYLHMLSTPFSSFVHMRYLAMSRRLQYNYIGYPRDTIALTAGTDFFKRDDIKLSAAFSWISRGEHATENVVWDWENGSPYNKEKTPSGKTVNNFVLSCAAQWKLYSFLFLNGNVTGIISNNDYGGQVSFSVRFLF